MSGGGGSRGTDGWRWWGDGDMGESGGSGEGSQTSIDVDMKMERLFGREGTGGESEKG